MNSGRGTMGSVLGAGCCALSEEVLLICYPKSILLPACQAYADSGRVAIDEAVIRLLGDCRNRTQSPHRLQRERSRRKGLTVDCGAVR